MLPNFSELVYQELGISIERNFIETTSLIILGNLYVNDKSTGAVVGQQPFGGSGKSGTNDKAGDINMLYRMINQMNIKNQIIY